MKPNRSYLMASITTIPNLILIIARLAIATLPLLILAGWAVWPRRADIAALRELPDEWTSWGGRR